MIRSFVTLTLAVFVLAALIPAGAAEEAPVKKLLLPGESFLISGRPAFVLLPPEAQRQQPQPWICYAPTLPGLPDAHETWMHQQFLDAGIAVAGIDVGEGYGSPRACALMDALYEELVQRRGFAAKPCLLGRSRGGLWVTSWASRHPERVAGIAGIYPVFDLRSYPGLERAAPAYGMTAAELEAALPQVNPVDRLDELARQRVPVFLIHGDQDRVVPLEKNSQAFVERYQAAGAGESIRLVVAKGQGHNYWEGFFRCQELVDFAVKQARSGRTPDKSP